MVVLEGGGVLASKVLLYPAAVVVVIKRFYLPPSMYNSYRGTSLITKRPSPLLIRERPPIKDNHRVLGIGLLLGPREKRLLMSEVPL
jgi:hypothetical protein